MRLLLVLSLTYFMCIQSNYSQFRNTEFGMTKAQVKEVETLKYVGESDGRFAYGPEVFYNKEYSLIYDFDKRGLMNMGAYCTLDTYQAYELVKDFSRLNDAVGDKYNRKSEIIESWNDESMRFVYKENPDLINNALDLGFLSYLFKYELPGFYILGTFDCELMEGCRIFIFYATRDWILNSKLSSIQEIRSKL